MIDPTPMYKHTSANVSTFPKAKFIKTNDKISSNFKIYVYLTLIFTDFFPTNFYIVFMEYFAMYSARLYFVVF